VLITGGIAYNHSVADYITQMISFIAPVFIYPGEDEMAALVENVTQMLGGKIPLKTYA
jgi:butyrate kinase